jgi:hypothetical protein
MNNKWDTRWASFENRSGSKGAGALTNKGVKGSAFERLEEGETVVLMDAQGSGIIHRMWLTIGDRSPRMLRSIRIDMYWDGADKPAVSAPLGDFFCAGLGMIVPFENELFSSPEGRSFHMTIPMPFRTRAVVTLTNESGQPINHLFYDINYSLTPEPKEDWLYFHAFWNRENRTVLGRDYAILPRVSGQGKLLGVNIGVITDKRYKGSWWGEGEVKVYLDGDQEYPTLVGTGTEDYIGTAWGQGTFVNRHQGCLVWDKESEFGSFYRFHIPDPIWFRTECRMDIQQIGGASKEVIKQFDERGVPYKVISIDADNEFVRLLEDECASDWREDRFGDKAWLNFQREDDFSSTVYFYLNTPENGLPELPAASERSKDLPGISSYS